MLITLIMAAFDFKALEKDIRNTLADFQKAVTKAISTASAAASIVDPKMPLMPQHLAAAEKQLDVIDAEVSTLRSLLGEWLSNTNQQSPPGTNYEQALRKLSAIRDPVTSEGALQYCRDELPRAVGKYLACVIALEKLAIDVLEQCGVK